MKFWLESWLAIAFSFEICSAAKRVKFYCHEDSTKGTTKVQVKGPNMVVLAKERHSILLTDDMFSETENKITLKKPDISPLVGESSELMRKYKDAIVTILPDGLHDKFEKSITDKGLAGAAIILLEDDKLETEERFCHVKIDEFDETDNSMILLFEPVLPNTPDEINITILRDLKTTGIPEEEIPILEGVFQEKARGVPVKLVDKHNHEVPVPLKMYFTNIMETPLTVKSIIDESEKPKNQPKQTQPQNQQPEKKGWFRNPLQIVKEVAIEYAMNNHFPTIVKTQFNSCRVFRCLFGGEYEMTGAASDGEGPNYELKHVFSISTKPMQAGMMIDWPVKK